MGKMETGYAGTRPPEPQGQTRNVFEPSSCGVMQISTLESLEELSSCASE